RHFPCPGRGEYACGGEGGGATLSTAAGSGLGVLRDDPFSVFDGLRNFDKLPPEVRYFLRQPRVLMITKANRRSTVHRPVYMDTIGVKKFDAAGTVVGERLFVGLLTSVAYTPTPPDTPPLPPTV